MQPRVCASFRPLSEDSRCLWGDAGGPRGQRAGGHRGKFGVSSVNKRVPTRPEPSIQRETIRADKNRISSYARCARMRPRNLSILHAAHGTLVELDFV